jgi:hypothetical protein
MERFFDLSFRPFFVITGIGTASASLYTFWPRWTAETVGKIPVLASIPTRFMRLGHDLSPLTVSAASPPVTITPATFFAERRPIQSSSGL